jgi:hypothetical protein
VAAEKGDLATCRELIVKGADVNVKYIEKKNMPAVTTEIHVRLLLPASLPIVLFLSLFFTIIHSFRHFIAPRKGDLSRHRSTFIFCVNCRLDSYILFTPCCFLSRLLFI